MVNTSKYECQDYQFISLKLNQMELSDNWVSQTTWSENIAAALTTFCRLHNIKISKKTIFENYSVKEGMSHFAEVERFCKDWEIKHIALKFVKEHLDQQFLPAFVLMKEYKTRLVMQIINSKVLSIDAGKGWMEESIDDFFNNSLESIVIADTEAGKEEPNFEEKEKEEELRITKIRNEFGIRLIDDFMSPEECEKLIKMSVGQFVKSKVVNHKKGEPSIISKVRTSSSAFLVFKDPFLDEIRERASKLVNLPKEHFESVQLTTYGKGELYEVHTDAFFYDKEKLEKEGQRSHTVLVYLNDDFEKGGTVFPVLDMVVKPKLGQAVVWSSLTDDGEIDKRAYHGGLPVLTGQKYICNLWVRNKPQAVWLKL